MNPEGGIVMAPAPKSTVIAVYHTHVEAEEAVRALQTSGFDITQLSIIGKGHQTEEQVVGYYTTGGRMKAWGPAGAFWGALWELLLGSAYFILPDIGPILAAGPAVVWIAGALERAAVVGGASPFAAGLLGVGIPEKSILEYQTHIKAGKFLVITHGSADAVDRARDALAATRHVGLSTHTAGA